MEKYLDTVDLAYDKENQIKKIMHLVELYSDLRILNKEEPTYIKVSSDNQNRDPNLIDQIKEGKFLMNFDNRISEIFHFYRRS